MAKRTIEELREASWDSLSYREQERLMDDTYHTPLWKRQMILKQQRDTRLRDDAAGNVGMAIVVAIVVIGILAVFVIGQIQ